MHKRKKIIVPVRFDEDVVKWMDELIDKREFDTRVQIIRKGVNELLKRYQEQVRA